MKTLLIVESPAKSKTIEKLLGPGYIVLSSFGHIRNLDKKGLGIDIENDFRPNYKILKDRSKQIKDIQEMIKKVDKVLLASDEDREGEAIAWHCAIVFKLNINENNRICFHEITKPALENAVNNPRKINMSMVHSQQARRILDRIVGFKLSPLLWKYIAPKLSAGRVQSVALKLIVNQENDIEKFTEKKYYKTNGLFDKKISASLNSNFENEDLVKTFLNDCKKSKFSIQSIQKNKVEKSPQPPYITSTIQQDCSYRFGIGSKVIMGILQKLYENGLITYHRTDSTNLSDQIKQDIKKYIIEKFDKKYLHLRKFISKIKCAQEAHEAIRPTNINLVELEDSYESLEKKIYNLIWKRTVASQMSNSISDVYTITISISNRKELFSTKAEKLLFDGYKKIYEDIKSDYNDDDDDKKDETLLPDFIIDNIKEGDQLKYINIKSVEKYQKPVGRYNESTLIKKMENIGIGRPSTYASIIDTILDRKYVEKKDLPGKKINIINFILENDAIKNGSENITMGAEKKKIIPTDLGKATIAFLDKNFDNILNSGFTSNLEENLDEIANSKIDWINVVKPFYNDFIPNVEKLNDKELVSKNYDDKKRLVGKNEDGKNVYSYIGKFGPLIQIGDEKSEIKYFKLDNKYSITTVTMKDIAEITKYPKNIGKHEGHDVFMKKGPYGFYISHNDKNYKLLEGFDENISLENSIKCINGLITPSENGENEKNEKKGTIKKIDKYIIKNGPYGYYIEHNKKFFSIPKEYDVEKLTKSDCDVIIKIPKKTYKKK
jgi:DNA topoisomerase-1